MPLPLPGRDRVISHPYFSQVELSTGVRFQVSFGPFRPCDFARALVLCVRPQYDIIPTGMDAAAAASIVYRGFTFLAGWTQEKFPVGAVVGNNFTVMAAAMARTSILQSSTLSGETPIMTCPFGDHRIPLNAVPEARYLTMGFLWSQFNYDTTLSNLAIGFAALDVLLGDA